MSWRSRVNPMFSIEQGVVVNRLISSVMLVGFATQQFVCCCAGACASASNDKNHSHPVCQSIQTDACDCGHHHETSEPVDTSPFPPENSPVNHEHHHHVCVGTHLFYLTAERFDFSQIAINTCVHCWFDSRVNVVSPVAASIWKFRSSDHRSASPPLTRAALGVYRI